MGERAARPPLTPAPPSPVPLEITRANEWDVRIRWSDGHQAVYPARYLREACPCAVCTEGTREAELDPDVHPLAIRAVGTYAIEVDWSDGHATGMYPYAYLRALCPCRDCRTRND